MAVLKVERGVDAPIEVEYLLRRRVEKRDLSVRTGDDDAVAHAVENRLQHLGLVAQLLFGPGQRVGSLLEGRAAFRHALLQRFGEGLQFLLCASALDDLLLERGPAAFELDVGGLQRRVPSLDLFEHAVEPIDELADFVAGGFFDSDGVVPVRRNRLHAFPESCDRSGDQPVQAIGEQIGKQRRHDQQ